MRPVTTASAGASIAAGTSAAIATSESAGAAGEEAVGRLLAQAYLFDDPSAYEAGVRDAVWALCGRSVTGDGRA